LKLDDRWFGDDWVRRNLQKRFYSFILSTAWPGKFDSLQVLGDNGLVESWIFNGNVMRFQRLVTAKLN